MNRNNRESETPHLNNSNMCARVYRGANHCSLDFLNHSATGRLLVSTILGLFSCHRVGMYDWFVDDEKMGCLYIHGLCSPKPGCSYCNGCLERPGPSDTRNSHILRTEECFKNDMTKLLNPVRTGFSPALPTDNDGSQGQAAKLLLPYTGAAILAYPLLICQTRLQLKLDSMISWINVFDLNLGKLLGLGIFKVVIGSYQLVFIYVITG